jgi:DtxR family Mn-dependent transcriptional regulator
MADPPPGLSRSVEDYLKAIYSLTERGESASTNDIAAALEVQPASVTGMIKRLAESGYLEHAPYRGVQLTDDGAREALRVIRRHRILEVYLSEKLGYSWDDVHREAERLEHAASDELIDRMAAALSDPQRDPHGAPIPSSSGEIEAMDHYTLADCVGGMTVTIRAVRDDDPERLRIMESRGLTPGRTLTIQAMDESGEVTVLAREPGGPFFTLGPELARRIFVLLEPRRASP